MPELKTIAQGAATSILAADRRSSTAWEAAISRIATKRTIVASRADSDGRHGVAAYALDPGNVGAPVGHVGATNRRSHRQLITDRRECLFIAVELPDGGHRVVLRHTRVRANSNPLTTCSISSAYWSVVQPHCW